MSRLADWFFRKVPLEPLPPRKLCMTATEILCELICEDIAQQDWSVCNDIIPGRDPYSDVCGYYEWTSPKGVVILYVIYYGKYRFDQTELLSSVQIVRVDDVVHSLDKKKIGLALDAKREESKQEATRLAKARAEAEAINAIRALTGGTP